MADMHYEHRMGDSDALLWRIEADPMLRSTITAVILLDRAPERDRVRALFERGCARIPRLRQRVRSHPLSIAPPRWETDPQFDLDYHLRFVRAPAPGTLQSMLELAQPMAMADFDRARPLWEAALIDGLEDDRAALVVKIHHTITDGVGMMQLALILFDLERDPAPDDPIELPVADVMSRWRRWWDAMSYEGRRAADATKAMPDAAGGILSTLRNLATDPIGTTRDVVDTANSLYRLTAPDPTPLSPAMVDRSLSVRFATFPVPMAAARKTARSAGVTLNDVFLGAVTGGMAHYHEACGSPADSLRFTVPISLRNEETESEVGNHVMLARVVLPLGITDPVRRMRTIHDQLAQLRAEPALGLTEPVAGILRRLPTPVGVGLFGGVLRGSDLITTNVPGSPIPLYSAGGRVERILAFAPLLGAAVNVSLISYLDDLNIGVNMDPAAVQDPAALVESLRRSWDEILAI